MSGPSNAASLGKGAPQTRPCENTGAAQLDKHEPVEWELGEYNGIAVHENTGTLQNFAGVLLQDLALDTLKSAGQSGNTLVVEGVVTAYVLGSTGATQGAWLKPLSGARYFVATNEDTGIQLLEDKSAGVVEVTAEVWIMPNRARFLDAFGPIDGKVVLDDDFLNDNPTNTNALILGGPWIKVETNGLGVVDGAEANGVMVLAFDAQVEAATADLHAGKLLFDIDNGPVFEFLVAIFDIGDNAALDINIGAASGTHATDFDSISEYAAFHLDGTDLDILCQSADGSTTVSAVSTGIDAVDDEYMILKVDFTDKSDVKFYVNGVRVLVGTTFDMSNYSGLLWPIVHVEKTSDNTTAAVHVDRIRVWSKRAA